MENVYKTPDLFTEGVPYKSVLVSLYQTKHPSHFQSWQGDESIRGNTSFVELLLYLVGINASAGSRLHGSKLRGRDRVHLHIGISSIK